MRENRMHGSMRGGWRGISPDQPPTLPGILPSYNHPVITHPLVPQISPELDGPLPDSANASI